MQLTHWFRILRWVEYQSFVGEDSFSLGKIMLRGCDCGCRCGCGCSSCYEKAFNAKKKFPAPAYVLYERS